MKEILDQLIEFKRYLGDMPDHINAFSQNYGTLVYAILFLIIFCETGLVVTPFLPGDSLLFAIGAVAANPASGLNIWIAALVLLLAAILGDTVNYWIGRKFGAWVQNKFPKIVKPSHIEKTNEFFVRYGGKTIIIARFVPVVRTFAPFVAGSGQMDYKRFMSFNVIGAILWVGLLLPAGYVLAKVSFIIPFTDYLFVVKEHFEVIVLGIIFVSILPMIIEIARAKLNSRKAQAVKRD